MKHIYQIFKKLMILLSFFKGFLKLIKLFNIYSQYSHLNNYLIISNLIKLLYRLQFYIFHIVNYIND